MRTSQNERLARRIEQLERENAALRGELERLSAANPADGRTDAAAARPFEEPDRSNVCGFSAADAILGGYVRHHVDPILVVGADYAVVTVNPSFERVFGWRSDELAGKHALEVPILSRVERVSVIAAIQALLAESKPVNSIETAGITKEGIPRCLLVSLFPILDADGAAVYWIVVVRDVTERRRSEELSRKADKLFVLGQLAAGVAHELRNPLTAVKGFVQLIKERPDALKRFYLDTILEEMERIEFIIRELLVLAGPQAMLLASVSVESLVCKTISDMSPIAAASGVTIRYRMPNDLPAVKCEEAQMKQVFMNIVQNAIDAMPGGGCVTIEARQAEPGKVEVAIADEGPGIPPDRLARLGEPFYTTKEKGAGLGLMVCHKVVAEHNGRLAFESGRGGTVVTVTIPAE